MAANIVIIAAIVIAVAVVIRNYVTKNVKHGCCGGGEDVRLKRPKDTNASDYAHAYRVKVDGMSCTNCAHRIANAFNEQDGFMAEVDLDHGEATVRTRRAAKADDLKAIVRNAGYGAGAVTEL